MPLERALSLKPLQCLGPCSYQLSHTGQNSTVFGHIIIYKNSECANFCILNWRISVCIYFLLKALTHYDTSSEFFIIDLSQVLNYYTVILFNIFPCTRFVQWLFFNVPALILLYIYFNWSDCKYHERWTLIIPYKFISPISYMNSFNLYLFKALFTCLCL